MLKTLYYLNIEDAYPARFFHKPQEMKRKINMSNLQKFNADLLELLVCPVTKGPLIYDEEKQELISKKAQLAFPIQDGIPILLEDKARKM